MTKIQNATQLPSTGHIQAETFRTHMLPTYGLAKGQMFWSLEIEICDLFEIWCLEFVI